MSTEQLVIQVSENGSLVVKRNLDEVGKSAKEGGTSIEGLKGALEALVAGEITHKLIEMADAFTEMQNRLRIVTTGVENLNAVQERLLEISRNTHTDLGENAELFTRFAQAAEKLGLSQKDALDFTDELNKAVEVSGGNAKQAEAGLLDLAKAMATGRLEGRQLVGLLRDLPSAAEIIAKSLGVTTTQLLLLGQEGQLTADKIVKAFHAAGPALDAAMGRRIDTIGESFQSLSNQVGLTVGSFLSAAGGAGTLVDVIDSLTDLIHEITPDLLTLAHALSGTVTETDQLSDSMKGVGIVLVTIIAVIETIAKVVVDVLGGAFRTVGQLMGGFAAELNAELHGRFKEGAAIFKQTVADLAKNVGKIFVDSGTDIGETTAKTVARLQSIWAAGSKKIQSEAKNATGAGINTTPGAGRPDPYSAQQLKTIQDLTIAITRQAGELQLQARLGDGAAAAIDRLRIKAELAKVGITGMIPASITAALRQLSEARAEEGIAKVARALGDQNQELQAQIAAGAAAGQATARFKAEQELAKAGVEGLTTKLKEQFDQLEKSQRDLAAADVVRTLADQTNELAIQAQLGYKAGDALAAYRLQVQLATVGLKELTPAIKDALAAQAQQQNNAYIKSLQDELELHGLVGDALRLETAQRQLSASATDEQRAQVKSLVTAQIEQENKLKQYQSTVSTVAKGAQDSFAKFLFDPFKGGLRGMLASFADTLRQMAAQLLANALLKKALGALGGATGGSGWASIALEALGGRAEGGPVTQGQPVWVGEKGQKELFVPHANGTVMTQQQISAAAGKGGAPNVSVPVQVVNVTDPNQIPNAIAGHQGTQTAILNFIGDNSTAINQMLGK